MNMETLLQEVVKARTSVEEIESLLEGVGRPSEEDAGVAWTIANGTADELERLERDIRSSLLTGESIR